MLLTVRCRAISTRIHADVSQQQLDSRTMEDRLIQSHQQSQRGIVDQINSSVDTITTNLDHVEQEISRSRSVILSRMPLTAVTAAEVNHIMERNLRRAHEEQTMQMQLRDARSEQLFAHLERVFRTVTAPPVVSHSRDQHHMVQTSLGASFHDDGQYECGENDEKLCADCLHGGPRTAMGRWSLWGFQSVLGSVAFTWRSTSAPPCKNAAQKTLHSRVFTVTYIFPTWLFHAALSLSYSERTGSPELVLRVIRRIPYHEMQAQGIPNLLHATRKGDLKTIKYLLALGQSSVFDVDAKGGGSVLFELGNSCWRDRPDSLFLNVLRILVFEGADLFQPDDFGYSASFRVVVWRIYVNPQRSASFCNQLQTIVPMDRVFDHCQFTQLHKIVLGITHINLPQYSQTPAGAEEINCVDGLGFSALAYASARGDISTVETLLKAGATPNSIHPGFTDRAPLLQACDSGHVEIVQQLLEAGADVNMRTQGRLATPLHSACRQLYRRHEVGASRAEFVKSQLDLVATLLSHGADIGAVDYWGCSVLTYALVGRHDPSTLR